MTTEQATKFFRNALEYGLPMGEPIIFTQETIEAFRLAIRALMKQDQTDSEETDEQEKELKPCPFCGGQAHIMQMGFPHWIYCEDCGAKIHGGKIGDGAEEASIKAWNRRRLPATKIFPPSE